MVVGSVFQTSRDLLVALHSGPLKCIRDGIRTVLLYWKLDQNIDITVDIGLQVIHCKAYIFMLEIYNAQVIYMKNLLCDLHLTLLRCFIL